MANTGPPTSVVLQLAIKSLWLHKLRTVLAMLGIVIGTCSVIMLLTLGSGSKQEALDQIKELGATNIIIRSEKPPEGTSAKASNARILKYGLTYDDYFRFAETIPTVWRIVPLRSFPREIHHLHKKFDGRVVGTSPEYSEVNKLELSRGRFISDRDGKLLDNVAVLGSAVAKELFPLQDPLEQTVKLGEHYYRVIGVTDYRTPSAGPGGSLSAENYNKDVYIPLATCRARFGDFVVDRRSGQFSAEEVALRQITMSVRETNQVRPTGQVVRALMDKYHSEPDFLITVPLDLLEDAERTALIWSLFLGFVASIALIVGGIGIANIMLASVMERTREIGIRRAIGAKRRDIAMQFLIEAITLTAIGGGLGVIVGIIFPEIASKVAEVFFNYELRTHLIIWSIPMAFLISVIVGVISGLYPARRAAMMDPIEALRHE